MRKRIISACLALCLALSLLPVNVWAAEDDQGITTISDLAAALTPEGGTAAPTVNGLTITLNGDVTLSKVLRINCNVTIDLNNHIIDADDYYIQVDSGRTVKLTNNQMLDSGTIKSLGDTAAVVAMRGCKLTIECVNIDVDDVADGYGILVHPDPSDKESVKGDTQLKLSRVNISGGQGGLMVDRAITEADSYPTLTLEEVWINQDGSSDRIGLYLAGMADTTVENSYNINGNPAIGIKSGALTVNGGTITGSGKAVPEPKPSEHGINGDGSAILIENNASFAGNVKITIDGGANISSENNYVIREFAAEKWTDTPQIEVKSGSFWSNSSSLNAAGIKTKIEHAQMTVGKGGEDILPTEPQTIEAYGEKNDKFQKAYDSIGLKLWKPSDGQPYTLEMDSLKLKKLLEDTNSEYRDAMVEDESSGNLWYKAKFQRPDGAKEAKTAEIEVLYNWWLNGLYVPSHTKEVELKGDSFYHSVTIYAVDTTQPGPPSGSYDPNNPYIGRITVNVRWMDQDGALLAVSEASINVGTAKPCTVKFIDGQATIHTDTVSRGDIVQKPEVSPKTDWVFDGWYTAPDGGGDLWDFDNNTVDKDITLYANWLDAVTVTFGGTTNPPVTVGKGTPVEEPEDPEREGYEFDGWFADAAYTKPWDFNTPINEDTTIYAKWKQMFTVTFKGPDGIDVPDQPVVEGGKATEPEDPDLKGPKFGGWFADEKYTTLWDFNTPITKDTTIYGRWKQTYTVTFDSQGGSPVEEQPVIEGGKAEKPDDPTRNDHFFNGWYKEPEGDNPWDFNYQITCDTTIYANWLPIYTVTFNSQGGRFDGQDGPETTTKKAVKGRTVEAPDAPERGGYRLDGWFKEENCENQWNFATDTVTENITLYAKWQETYTVTFDSQDGNPKLSNQTVDKGSLVTKPAAPTKENFDFDDWYKEADCKTKWNFETDIVTENVTLYAGWTKAAPRITFDANGGTFASGAPTTKDVPTNTEGKLTEFPADPSRTGYTFAGWYTEAEGGRLVTASTTFTESATVYAHWTVAITPSKPRTYTITFNANGGGSNVTLTTGTDGKLAALPDAPSRTGYTFDGWYTAPSGGTQITKDTVFQGHTTVYAHWKEGSGQPSDPSNPSNPSNPSGVQYQVYAPSASSGGSFYISHTAAAEGQRVTITLTPWSGYQLYQLSVTNYVTGRQLSLSRVSTNVYAFTMPASSVSVAVTFTRSTSITPPQTINQSAGWYFSGSSIYHRTSGIVPSAQPLTRDMLISVLYSLDGSSHEEPAVWAVSNGIVPDVYSSLLWGSDKSLTREQTVMILYCYAEYKGYGTSQRASLAGYSDYSQIRAAAQHAMSWARATGLMTGTSATTLSPQANLTCEQANIVLSRFITSVVRR